MICILREKEREIEKTREREREIITYHGTFEVIQSLIAVASKSKASLPCIKLRVILKELESYPVVRCLQNI